MDMRAQQISSVATLVCQPGLKIVSQSPRYFCKRKEPVMVRRTDLFHLSFYKKTHFTGSYGGMRYYITKARESDAEDAPDVLRAIIYPEPYNFEHTPDEDKTSRDFPFTEEGLDLACDWLNEQYEARSEYWQLCLHADL